MICDSDCAASGVTSQTGPGNWSDLGTGQTGPSLGSRGVLLLISLNLNFFLFFFCCWRGWKSMCFDHWRPQRLVLNTIWEFCPRYFPNHIHNVGTIAANLLKIFREKLDLLPNKIPNTKLRCSRSHSCHQVPLKEGNI